MLFPKALIVLMATLALECQAYPYNSEITLEARRPLPIPSLPESEDLSAVANLKDHNNNDRGNNRNSRNKNNDDKNDLVQVTQVEEIQKIVKNNQVVEQIQDSLQQILLVNQDNNVRRNSRRRNAYREKHRENTSVILVVQKIMVTNIQESAVTEAVLFAQSAITANRGRRHTDTFMLIAQETLLIDGLGKNNFKFNNGSNSNSNSNNNNSNNNNDSKSTTTTTTTTILLLKTTSSTTRTARAPDFSLLNPANKKTVVTLLGSQPTWSVIASDVPAVTQVPLIGTM